MPARASASATPRPGPGARRWSAVAALAALIVGLSGCYHYDADIRVARDGSVTVRERLRIDPEWKAAVQDTLQAAEQIMRRYVAEVRDRGGRVVASGGDSAVAEFRYRSLADFDRAWPDSSDQGQMWDRSVYRRGAEGGRATDELILWRMSPPDRSQAAAGRRNPVLTFRVTLPAAALHHNAHVVRDGVYCWRFTEQMAAPDSVWIVWPATER